MATPQSFDDGRKNPLTGQLSVKIVVDRKAVGIIPSQYIQECYFVEDIFESCITGKIVFTDTMGLLENGPLTGDERLTLTYGVDDNREVNFYIWQIKKIVQTSTTAPTDDVILEIIFVDESYYAMHARAISYSFPAETKYTAAVKYLYKNMVGFKDTDLNIEACTNFHIDPIALPYWTVAECTRFLLRRAKSAKTASSGYLSYNNTDEGFKANIRTLNWLFSSNNKIDAMPYIFENTKTEVKDNNKIWEWWGQGVDKSAMKPARGGKWRAVNTGTKKLIETQYTYGTGVINTTTVGTKSLFPDISDNNSYQRLTGEQTEDDLKMVIYDEWIKSYNTQMIFNFVLPGHEKRFAGQQIEVKWPSITRNELSAPVYHKQFNGKFVIKSVTHIFGQGQGNINYMQRLVVLKNGYQAAESEKLINIPKDRQNISELPTKRENRLVKT